MSQIKIKNFIANNVHAFPVRETPVFCICSVVYDDENKKCRFTDTYENIYDFIDALSGYYESDFMEQLVEHEDNTISFGFVDERNGSVSRVYYEIVFFDDFYYVYEFTAVRKKEV